MKNSLRSLLLTCLLAVLPARAAEVMAPDALAKSVTDEVLALLRADKQIQAGDTRKAAQLIETRVLPHFDFPAMTRLTVGKSWAQATPGQREALTGEFRTLLVRTYTASLTLYRDQTIEYRPLKLAPADTDAVVKSLIRQPGAAPISVDYAMEKTGTGWKVYDVTFAGMSLVGSYRTTFSAEIQKGGVDGLIRALAEKNKAMAQG